ADLFLELAPAAREPADVHEDAEPDGGVRREEVSEVVVHAAAPSRASTSRRSAVTSDSSRAPRARNATSQPASSRMAIDDTYSVSRIVGSVRPDPPSLVVSTAGWMPCSKRTETRMTGMSSTPTIPSTAAYRATDPSFPPNARSIR